ncbi:hypothetical protein OG2516_15719 [Oceanicola granulosus HTCC2516]|uniref:FG-GAP repeat domain protein n=1 Tax=Oceanicola granulosus (strain ATCC BAA-861 / DSM 15982 / KCTC 12143 / HTCC2516) TaxID=314256 RepID=Q2CBX0_OCEGH|nr:VCBS repeat-containing protein [Oceanicola granulosus]EAR50150.1 hypothetical protein OG2516_15719 [Oceanicola granulosus HTCC2516]
MLLRAALLAALAAGGAAAQGIDAATYAEPTDRYPHGALGDPVEWGALVLETARGPVTVRLPEERVFEDTAPRVVDVDGDGATEAVVVESNRDLGARLAIYGAEGTLIAANDWFGQRNRWLAPVGVADLDGDGRVELAYIDRPHLAKRLIVLEFADGALREEAVAEGLTNHSYGEPAIHGGLRDCGDGIEMITADADWSRVMATRLRDGRLESRALGPFTGLGDLAAALDCPG